MEGKNLLISAYESIFCIGISFLFSSNLKDINKNLVDIDYILEIS